MGHFIFIFFFSLNDNDYLPFSHPCISIGLRDSVLQHCSLYTSQSNQFTDFLWYRLHVSSSVWTLPFPFFLSLSLYLSHWFFSSFLLNFCGCSLAAEIQSLKIYSNVIQRIRGVLNTQRSFSGRTWNDFICKISEWVSEWLYNAETNATQHTPKNNLENRKHVRLRMSMTRSENIMHKYGLHTMLYESASHYEFRLKWFD